MSLVTNTLSRYLKLRFNSTQAQPRTKTNNHTQPSLESINTSVGAKLHQEAVIEPAKDSDLVETTGTTLSTTVSQPVMSVDEPNDGTHDEAKTNICNGLKSTESHSDIVIQHISLANLRPCCIAVRDDLQHIAAGFENSHIYMWLRLNDNSDQICFDKGPIRMLGHSGPVYALEFFNKYDLMISCSEDTTIRLWCLKTKCNLAVYRGHQYPVWALSVSLQENYFASGSMDATARIFQLTKMTPVRILCGHEEDVDCVRFHPNEKYVATGSSDTTVRLWSVADGRMVRLFVGHDSPIVNISFLPDGKLISSASLDGKIILWNLATNDILEEYVSTPMISVDFSHEQSFVSTCGVDNVMRLWHIDKVALKELRKVDFARKATKLLTTRCKKGKLFVFTSYT